MSSTRFDTVIIGGGPAGLSAAIYAGRASLSALVVEQGMPGGQIATTDEIENYPGIPSISGAELGLKLQEHAEKFGASIAYGSVERIERNEDGTFTVSYSSESATAPTVIYTGGAIPRLAGFKGEDAFRGRGVSYCATCDGMFYRNKHVYVIGGGNSACEEALYLAGLAKKVYMIVRKPFLRASEVMQKRVKDTENIEILFEHNTLGLFGDGSVEGVRLVKRKGEADEQVYELPIDGFFLAIGHKPNSDIFKPWLDTDETGYIVTQGDSTRTKVPGVFAAGDVADPHYRQAITAAASGCRAAIEADRYLREQGIV